MERGKQSAPTGGAQPKEGTGRRALLRRGLLVGAATVGLTAAFAESAQAATGNQVNWYWCNYCAMTFHSANAQPDGTCITGPGGKHNLGSGTEYRLHYGYPGGVSSYQVGWTWCGDCQVLFYGPNIAASGCHYAWKIGRINAQSYAAHRAGSTTSYDAPLVSGAFTDVAGAYQSGWNYCLQCKSLFHGSGNPTGSCIYQAVSGYQHKPGPTPYWMQEVGG